MSSTKGLLTRPFVTHWVTVGVGLVVLDVLTAVVRGVARGLR